MSMPARTGLDRCHLEPGASVGREEFLTVGNNPQWFSISRGRDISGDVAQFLLTEGGTGDPFKRGAYGDIQPIC